MKTVNFVSNNTTTESRPEAQIYLNICYGNGEVTLPFGLALDTMPDQAISGSAEWQNQVLARNKFKTQLLEFIKANCKPGETIKLTGVSLQARVKNQKVETSTVDDMNFSFGLA